MDIKINQKLGVTPEIKDKIKCIIDKGLKIKLLKHEDLYIQKDIKDIYADNTELINLFQKELLDLQQEIKIQKQEQQKINNKIILKKKKNF